MLYTSNWRVVTCHIAKLVQVMVSCYILEKISHFMQQLNWQAFHSLHLNPSLSLSYLLLTIYHIIEQQL